MCIWFSLKGSHLDQSDGPGWGVWCCLDLCVCWVLLSALICVAACVHLHVCVRYMSVHVPTSSTCWDLHWLSLGHGAVTSPLLVYQIWQIPRDQDNWNQVGDACSPTVGTAGGNWQDHHFVRVLMHLQDDSNLRSTKKQDTTLSTTNPSALQLFSGSRKILAQAVE